MKWRLFFCLILTVFSFRSFAQTDKIDSLLQRMLNKEEPPLPTKEMIHHINEDVYIYDIISDYKVVNNKLKILYIGGSYPNQQVTIFIKGTEPNTHADFKKGEKWHFSGKAFIYHKKPAIIVTNPVQLGTQIQI